MVSTLTVSPWSLVSSGLTVSSWSQLDSYGLTFSLILVSADTHVSAHSNWSANYWPWSATLNCIFLQHMCVCSQQQANPELTSCAPHSSIWSANGCKRIKTFIWLYSAPNMCVCVCSQQHLVMCMPAAAIGRPTLDPWVQPSMLYSATHMCVCAHGSNWFAKVVECSKPSIDSFTDFCCNSHVCAHSSRSAKPQLTFSATHMCLCSQQQLVCKSF